MVGRHPLGCALQELAIPRCQALLTVGARKDCEDEEGGEGDSESMPKLKIAIVPRRALASGRLSPQAANGAEESEL